MGNFALGCFVKRLMRYYERHYTEIDVLNEAHVRMKALELLGLLCGNLLASYDGLRKVVNRLRQHGQRERDRVAVRLADEAVEDMILLKGCVQASKRREESEAAKENDDL